MLIGELLCLQSEDRVVPPHQLIISYLTHSLEASFIISQVLVLVTCGRSFSEEFVNVEGPVILEEIVDQMRYVQVILVSLLVLVHSVNSRKAINCSQIGYIYDK
jgi:hypothetical protein